MPRDSIPEPLVPRLICWFRGRFLSAWFPFFAGNLLRVLAYTDRYVRYQLRGKTEPLWDCGPHLPKARSNAANRRNPPGQKFAIQRLVIIGRSPVFISATRRHFPGRHVGNAGAGIAAKERGLHHCVYTVRRPSRWRRTKRSLI